MAQAIYSILVSLFIFLIVWGLGDFFLCLILCRDSKIDKTLRFIFSSALGLIILSTIVLISGLCGFLSLWFYLLLSLLPVFLILKKFIRSPVNKSKFSPFKPQYLLWWNKLINIIKEIKFSSIIFLLIIPLVCVFSTALLPDTSGDAYLYHITVPKFYFNVGKIIAVRYSFCYNYPLQMEMIYLLGIIFHSEVGGVLINFWILILLLITIFKLSEMMFSRLAGWIAVLTTSTLPILHIWTPTSHIELATSFFLLISLVAIKRWCCEKKKRYLFLAGIFCGGMISSKIFYLIAFLLLFFLIIAHSLKTNCLSINRKNILSFLTEVIILAFGVFLSLLPWAIKNYLFTNNPLFPFLIDFITTRQDLISGAKIIREAHAFPLNFSMINYIKNIQDIISQMTAGMNYLSIITFFLLPFLTILANIRNRENLWFWLFCLSGMFWILHYGLIGQVRWFIPIWILFNVVVGWAGDALSKKIPPFKKTGLTTFTIFLFLIFAYQQYLFYYETEKYPWTAFSKKTREKFLSNQANYQLSEVINKLNLKRGFILLGASPFLSCGRWLSKPFIQEGLEYFKDYEKREMTLEDALADLKQVGVSHLLFPQNLEESFTKEFFKKFCVPIVEYRGMILYEITG